ncbi:IPT/TIG domain-containing protein, partial [Streptomyces sioyaensis]|uniref:IPT/TIG domain-containing protein n=1 Tax=Streptomyces sioyaensis TaxID=67364 RepID=UPI0033C15CB3
GSAGPADVVVTTPGGVATLAGAFTYVAAPTLTGISPAQGPAAGGTVVTINGTNLSGASVTIGGNPATGVSVNPAGTQITATTPAGSAGPADVVVTTPGGVATLAGAFTYVAAPTLTGISPTQGSTAGGTVVTITGTNLSGASVTIGGNPATGVSVNPAGTQITATTPAGAPGPATVVVTTLGGSARLVNGFTYVVVAHASQLTVTPALLELFPPQVYYPFLYATLTDLVTGLPVPGQTITFTAGSNFLGTATTNAQGIAQLSEVVSFPLILFNGGYTAAFAGTPTLQPSTAHGGIIAP